MYQQYLCFCSPPVLERMHIGRIMKSLFKKRNCGTLSKALHGCMVGLSYHTHKKELLVLTEAPYNCSKNWGKKIGHQRSAVVDPEAQLFQCIV